MSLLAQVLHYKIVAILRGIKPGDAINVTHALYAGGIRILEVTLNSENALAQIEQLNNTMGNDMLIGAGTVLDAADARSAVQAGARFLISPIVDFDVIKIAKEHDVISIPGAYTATEIVQAHRSGGDIIKVFPVSDAAYIKALLAPLNGIKLMPTGGVTLDNITAFKQAGAAAFCIGISLVPPTHDANEPYLNGLTEKARRFIQALQTA